MYIHTIYVYWSQKNINTFCTVGISTFSNFGPKKSYKKNRQNSKRFFELYQVFMYILPCQNVWIFPNYQKN